MSFSTFSTENLMNLLSQSLVSSALQSPYFFLQSSQVNTSDRSIIVFETTPLFDNKTTKFWNSLTLIFSICEIILVFIRCKLLSICLSNKSALARAVLLYYLTDFIYIIFIYHLSKHLATFVYFLCNFLCLFAILETKMSTMEILIFVVPRIATSIYLYSFYNPYFLSISMIATPCFNIYILQFPARSQLTLFFWSYFLILNSLIAL